MTSDRKIQANRRNAQKSTGPRTPEGRANSRSNALKHGLTAKKIILPDEKPEDFEDFYAEFYADLAPVGVNEESLADRIILGEWRSRRFMRMEADQINRDAVELLGADLDPESGGISAVLQKSPGAFALLWRYGSGLAREVRQARHDLERLQARRRGEAVAAPVAIDVSASLNISHKDVPQQPSQPAEDCIDQGPTPDADPEPSDESQDPVRQSLAAAASPPVASTTEPSASSAPAPAGASSGPARQTPTPPTAPQPAPAPPSAAAAPSRASQGPASSGPMSAAPYDMASIYPWMSRQNETPLYPWISRQNAASIYPWMSRQKTSPYPWISPEKWEEYMRWAGLI